MINKSLKISLLAVLLTCGGIKGMASEMMEGHFNIFKKIAMLFAWKEKSGIWVCSPERIFVFDTALLETKKILDEVFNAGKKAGAAENLSQGTIFQK